MKNAGITKKEGSYAMDARARKKKAEQIAKPAR